MNSPARNNGISAAVRRPSLEAGRAAFAQRLSIWFLKPALAISATAADRRDAPPPDGLPPAVKRIAWLRNQSFNGPSWAEVRRSF